MKIVVLFVTELLPSDNHLKFWLTILTTQVIVYELIRSPIAKGDRSFVILGNRSELKCHPVTSSCHFSWQFSIRSVCAAPTESS